VVPNAQPEQQRCRTKVHGPMRRVAEFLGSREGWNRGKGCAQGKGNPVGTGVVHTGIKIKHPAQGGVLQNKRFSD
jgi:hypothetical protein